jgi:hypothetical protein
MMLVDPALVELVMNADTNVGDSGCEPARDFFTSKWNSFMRNGLIAIVAAGAIVAVAIVEGKRTNRWGASEDIQAAARKLENVPLDFDNWKGTDYPIDEKIIRVAEAVGNVSRSYVNSKNGERINVLLLCGPTGPIGAHTPDVCYGGLGFACKGNPARKSITYTKDGAANFWTARFEKKLATDEALRVYWAWSVNGNWEASSNPRTDYAFRSVLYKLYLVRADDPGSQPRDPKKEPIDLFLEDFLPIVRSALTTTPG